MLGIFALTTQGLEGGVFTMISHGLTTGALFLLVGFLYDRRHTFNISDFGGLWKAAPVFGGIFLAVVFASIGLPGFSGFVGEFLALIGTFIVHRPYAVISAVGVILAAVYLLWAYQRVFHGPGRRCECEAARPQGARAHGSGPVAGAQPLPRHLPEAGDRPGRAVGAPRDLRRRAGKRLQGARGRRATDEAR